MTRFTPPDQEEVERQLSAALKGDHGKISRVAGLSGLHRSQLSRYINPECPEKSPVYVALMLLESCRYTDSTDGQHSFDDIARIFVDFITTRMIPAEPTTFSARELHEVIDSFIERSPYGEQLSKVRRAKAVLESRERELMELDGKSVAA